MICPAGSIKSKGRQRVLRALSYQQAIEERLAFHRISIRITDNGRHWRFFHEERLVAEYWPHVCKVRVEAGSVCPCGSPVKAIYAVENAVKLTMLS